ncbi:multidrug efflux MFS transporter SdrM [Staphylococcus debuckii]|uniref:multidrug efflux MFS transporter SdrM n=1 Tax=Staphylococcus debuckii TaxID=2044912 RepID=UPI000F4358BA|nr:multidrug efflux MFS transporter SdrM [Staphylococcus debuckii]AYU55791.1 MFS transporter [Staphylococcus debuckii]
MKLKSIGVVTALVLIMFMSAIETSIISLALPTIKQDLNVTASISLVFSVYFIALVIVNPLVGEFLSRFKLIYVTITGLFLFSIGSLFSGLSSTFTLLIISRFVQGLGAGIMMVLSQIVPKLAFEIPLRYKIMGIVGSVWGISSIIGPLLGGGILEFATWHWLFFINIPIAVIAAVLAFITFHFDEDKVENEEPFDSKGLSFFYLTLIFIVGAVTAPLPFWLKIIAFVIGAVIAYKLFKVEKKMRAPFLPVSEFNRTITLVFVTDFIYAMILMGYNLYMSIYLQEELGLSPLQSGFVVFPISVAWLVINFNLHRIEANITRKTLYIVAFTSLLVCSILIFATHAAPVLLAITLLLAGASFGVVYTKDSVIVQEETSPNEMKRMMSFYSLSKNLGNSIGSTIMGGIYAMPFVIGGARILNNVTLIIVFILILFALWLTLYKNNKSEA